MAVSRSGGIWLKAGAAVLGIVIIVVLALWIFQDKTPEPQPLPQVQPGEKTLPRMANQPEKKVEQKPPPPTYAPDAPLLQKAREALASGISPEKAMEMARGLPDQPERHDAAFLLLEFAADGGNPNAALAVGEYYDPSNTTDTGTIRKNAVTAYEWYQTASDAGVAEARNRIDRLMKWAKNASGQGVKTAKELLETAGTS